MARLVLRSLTWLLLLPACGHPSGDDPPRLGQNRAAVTSIQALPISADTFVSQARPNRAHGTDAVLRLRRDPKKHVLVAVDPAALSAALAGKQLRSAKLEVTLLPPEGRGGGRDRDHDDDDGCRREEDDDDRHDGGHDQDEDRDRDDDDDRGPRSRGARTRSFGVHRMLRAFSEAGATYNCSADTAPNNGRRDCSSASRWRMQPGETYAAAQTARATLSRGQVGAVQLDVTADIAAFVAGTPHRGWILVAEREFRGVSLFSSREGATPPRLLLELEGGGPSCPSSVDDGNPCTVDSCTAGVVHHDPVPNGTSCADATVCNGAETCSSGTCVAGTPLAIDDGNVCTVDACDPTAGVTHTAVADGSSCADSDVCNGTESCSSGTCVAGTPLPTDDENVCTVDACDPLTGVSHVAVSDGTSCADADACNGAEACVSGVCMPGAPPALDDANVCTADACDPATGVTNTPVPDGTGCPNGNACDGAETCSSGACVAGTPPPTNDNNPCTVDACDPALGPTHVAVADGTSCGNGNACDGAETCSSGTCVSGVPPATDDLNPCTVDTCDAVSGVSHVAVADGTSCSNGDACDGAETCSSGTCVAGTAPPTDDGNPCTVDTCTASGGVSHTPAAAGTPCANADLCDGVETCDGAGACVAGTPPNLDDGNPCTVDACSSADGITHVAVADGTSCADASICNGAETCSAGTCRPGTPLVVDDGNGCTADACDPVAGVSHTPTTGALCSDGNPCNGIETCGASGACLAGLPPVLEDGDLCTNDTCDPVLGIRHTTSAGCLLPDPATVAPAVDGTVSTTLLASTSFLYQGTNPIQFGVYANAITERAAATVRGRVMTREGVALPDVRVTVFGHPEFGWTLSRTDGRFDLAVNGGGLLVFDFNRAGYLVAQRQTEVSWQTGAELPDVALVPLDGSPTVVAFGAPTGLQVARGSTSTDIQGSRQGTLMFQPGTLATIHRPDGTSVNPSSLNVRITEYTIGPNGPIAMPGPLPEPSAYTYAIEVSADETPAGSWVGLSRPAAYYVENFLGFTIGAPVPVGYYDDTTAKWVASQSGVVLRIVGTSAGLAQLDTNGDNVAESAATLAALGITNEELGTLATTYSVGQSLWRFNLPHFTPWDANMGWEPVPPAPPPNNPPPPPPPCLCCGCCGTSGGGSSGGGSGDGPMSGGGWDTASGSVIGCERQTLAEDLSLTGTPYSLHYESDRQPGFKPLLHVPLSGSVAGTTLAGITLDVSLGGRTLHSSHAAASNAGADVYWDGKDQYGRFAQGGARADIRVGFQYPMRRVWTGQFGYNGLPGAPIELTGPAFTSAGIHSKSSTLVQRWLSEPAVKLGGWQLDVLHSYDLLTRTLYRGNGTMTGIEAVSQRITTAVGRSNPIGIGPSGPMAVGNDGSLYWVQTSPYTNPVIFRREPSGNQYVIFGANFIDGLTAAPNGDLYAVTSQGGVTAYRIYKITPSGAVTLIAGNGGGTGSLPPEGVYAPNVALRPFSSLAVARDGTVYFPQSVGIYTLDVMAVGPDGLLRRVAGNGATCNCAPDGADARNTALPVGLGFVTMGPSDVLYLASKEIVMRLGHDGRLVHVAGQYSGAPPWALDGGNARSAEMVINGMTVASDGALYVNEGEQGHYMCQLRKITTDGKIYMMTAGPGDGYCYNSNFTEGDIGWQVRLSGNGGGIQSAPDGSLYLARNVGGYFRIMRLSPGYSGIGLTQYVIPDGPEIHVFSQAGKHLRTLLAKTGATLRTFGYDAHGYVSSITDGDGNVTTIERSTAGVPSAIVGPYGHRTSLTLDGDGYLATVTNPANETHELTYEPGGLGLLNRFRTPRGFDHTFSYDANGRLQVDADPAGGSTTIARTGDLRDYTATRTTGLGRITRYRNQVTTRGRLQTRTQPTGTVDTVETTIDGRTVATASDGSTSQSAKSKDPRFGTTALMTTYSEARTPSGLLRQTSASASVALSNPADPLTMTSESEYVTVNGRTSSASFVVGSRTQTTTSPAGRTTTTVVDAQERPVSITVPGLTPVQVSYDSRGRPQTVTQGTRQYTIAYDASGRTQTVTDPLLRTQSYTYDNEDRVLSQTLPDGRQIGFTYDAGGNLASLTPPGRPAHTFAWTPIDQESLYTPPDLGTGAVATSRTYNIDRQSTRVVRPDGREVDYVYGANSGRLDQMTIARGAYLYGYDPQGRISGITAPDGGAMTFAYDGSLPLGTTWSGSVAGSVTRGYDASFRNTSVSVNGSAITLGYDNDDLLTSAGALTLARNAQNGLLSGTTLGAVTETLGYNGFGEVVTYSAQQGSNPLLSFDYGTRDGLGRIRTRTESVFGNAHVFGYSYDLAGRLTDVTTDSVATGHYEYDANGNRTLANGVSATYDAQDRLLTFGTKSYTYTANGELATKTDSATGAVTAYSYDELGNLTRVDLPDGRVVEYVVDGLNRRVAKKVDGVVVAKWLWESQLRIAAELDASNAVVSRFVHSTKSNIPDYMVRGGVTYRILTDHLGSPRLVVDASTGAEVQRMSFDEWGVLQGDTNPGFTPFGFAGGLFDRDTGLVRFGARDYDAETGRWTAKDPIGFAGGLTSLYSYVGADPVNASDPEGEGPLDYIAAYLALFHHKQELNKEVWFNRGQGNDKFHHCMAMCTARKFSEEAGRIALDAGEERERRTEQYDPSQKSECDADRQANQRGHRIGATNGAACVSGCAGFYGPPRPMVPLPGSSNTGPPPFSIL